MNRRRRRVLAVTACLLGGGMVLQLAACGSLAANLALGALDFCSLTFTADCTVGPFAPCGIPDTATVDAQGNIGPIMNAEDDLLLDCPVTLIPVTTGT